MGDNMYGEGTMSVEMAIHREMEYRRKLARMKQIPEAEFCKNLRPFVVQSPMPGPSLGSHQRPSSNATLPLPKLQGPNHDLKSSHPSSSSECGQLHPSISASSLRPCPNRSSGVNLEIPLRQQQGPNNQSVTTSQPLGLGNFQNHNDYTFCKICEVPCSGYANFMQHMEGRKHKNKQLEVKLGVTDSGARESPRRWCETCKIWCMNEEIFQVHLAGKPHIQKLEKGNGKQIVVVKPGFSCDLCHIECSSEELLIQHFKGKKHNAELGKGKRHIAQVHESQNKKARF